jgi:hypothetical protein
MDGYQNLNIIYHDGYRLYWKSCTYGCRFNTIKNTDADQNFEKAVCGFTDDSSNYLYSLGKDPLRTTSQYQRMRFVKSSVAYSTYLDATNPISVINDCLVELDIIGVPGTYAYRLRNENDENWSAWLPINSNLPTQNIPENELSENPLVNENTQKQIQYEQDFFKAYFVEKERFVAPWITSKNNGNKRICCEILTFFGKTEAFCLDFIASYEQLEYKVDFFADEKFTIPMPQYNSLKVVSPNITKTVIQENDLTSLSESLQPIDKIFVRVEFKNKEKMDIANRLRMLDRYKIDITMSIIQQGLNDQLNISLFYLSLGLYVGVFNVYKNDGVFNIDGLALVLINFPNSCYTALNNGANQQSSGDRRYNNLEQKIAIFDNFTTYKDIYDLDDPKYTFGSSEYYQQLKFNISDDALKYKRNSWLGGGVGGTAYRDGYGNRIEQSPVINTGGGQNGGEGGGEGGGGQPGEGNGGYECDRVFNPMNCDAIDCSSEIWAKSPLCDRIKPPPSGG